MPPYLGGSGFDNCQGTIIFVSMIDNLFDIFNSRTPAVKGFIIPLRRENVVAVESFLQYARSVLLNMKDMSGEKVYEGKRMISIVGFAMNGDSLLHLGKELLFGPTIVLRYILTGPLIFAGPLRVAFSCQP